jgi:hypothetical protein
LNAKLIAVAFLACLVLVVATNPAPGGIYDVSAVRPHNEVSMFPAPRDCSPITTWRPIGSAPLSDRQAAARVCAKPENRPDNADENRYVASAREIAEFRSTPHFSPLVKYVTGDYKGTTDEILQWAAHKWGIPEDTVRAVAVTESWWRMSEVGDRVDGVDASRYPPQARIDLDSVHTSMGIMQVKWKHHDAPHPGTEPLRWKSTAFNADYWGSMIRYYFEGRCDWCAPGYSAGQEWNSIGAWYNPTPWGGSAQLDYINRVKGHLANRTWEWWGCSFYGQSASQACGLRARSGTFCVAPSRHRAGRVPRARRRPGRTAAQSRRRLSRSTPPIAQRRSSRGYCDFKRRHVRAALGFDPVEHQGGNRQ